MRLSQGNWHRQRERSGRRRQGNIFLLCLKIFSCQRTILFLIFGPNVIFILVPWEELQRKRARGERRGMVCDRQQVWQDARGGEGVGGLSPCDYHNYKYRLLLLAGECLKLPSQTAPTHTHTHIHTRTLELDIRVTPLHTHTCAHSHTHVHTSMGSNLRLSLFSPATKLSFGICNAFMLQLLP